MKKILLSFLTIVILINVAGQERVQKKQKKKRNNQSSTCVNPTVSKSGKNTVYKFEYNYNNPKKWDDCTILPRHHKSEVYIILKNINRMLYDIEANGTSQSIPLQDISFDSLMINAGPISKTQGVPVSNPDENLLVLGITGTPVKNKDGSTKVRENPFFKQQKTLTEKLSYINDNYSAWLTKMQELELFLQFAKNVPIQISGERFSQSSLQLKLLTDANIIQFDGSIITTPGSPVISSDYPKLKSSVNNKPAKLANEIKATYEKMVKAKQEIQALIQEIKLICKAKLPGLTNDDCDTDQYESGLPEDIDKAIEEAKKIDVTKITETAGKIAILLNQVEDPANFEYQLNKPFTIEGDWYDAKLIIKPKTAYKDQVAPDSFVYKFPVKGKFEWAIGAALNFHISSSLLDQSFQIDSARTVNGTAKKDTFNIKKNHNRNTWIPSIGMMAHFYWQQHSSVTPGIVFGLSTSSVELKDLRAYLGVSAIVGGLSDKIFFNGGFAFGWADRLKSNLEEGENPKSQIPFNGDKIGSPDQLVEKAFKTGWFIGLTYKLSK